MDLQKSHTELYETFVKIKRFKSKTREIFIFISLSCLKIFTEDYAMSIISENVWLIGNYLLK